MENFQIVLCIHLFKGVYPTSLDSKEIFMHFGCSGLFQDNLTSFPIIPLNNYEHLYCSIEEKITVTLFGG